MPEPIVLDLTDLKRRGPQLPPGTPLSGAYLLTFSEGEQFAGATDNVVLRIGSHRRTWDDMTQIDFWPDARGGRSPWPDVRRQRMAIPEPPTWRIDRNDPGIDPFLDRLRWADEHLPASPESRPNERPGQREQTRSRFEQLQGHRNFAQIVALLQRYLALFVPAPLATEMHNWVVTAMPSTSRTRLWHRLICLSIHNVEAVTIGEQFDGTQWHTLGFMSANPAVGSAAELMTTELRAKGVFFAPARYQTVGPVYQVGFDSLDGLAFALDNEEIQDLTGALAMRLIKRGRGLYGRFHDYNLADVLLGDGGAGIALGDGDDLK